MSNELTPQQKYPKFYESPHLWIGAIEVQGNGDKFSQKLNYELYAKIDKHYSWPYYKPLFKPKEGKQFIKDLETAVSAGSGKELKLDEQKLGYKWFISAANDNFHAYIFVTVSNNDISCISTYATDGVRDMESPRNFDCAAYVDTLRKLGYYL